MNTSFALTAVAVAGMLIGNLAVTADRADRAKDFKPVANEVADTVANKPVVTETETHRIKCAEVKDGTCTEYIIFRIVKE